MPTRIDHLVVAASNLDWLCRWWHDLTDSEAVSGGAHQGWGTRNALVGLGRGTYLELIGPDVGQPEHRGRRPFGIDDMAPETVALVTFAVAVDDLDAAVATVANRGLEPGPIAEMSRVRPDGVRLSWRLATPPLSTHGGVQPFTIEWGEGTPHPSSALPGGVTLVGLALASPDAAVLGALFEDLDLEVDVGPSDRPMLSATLSTPNGLVGLSSV